MNKHQEPNEEKREQLLTQIETFIQTFWRLNRRNTIISNGLIIGGIVLGVGITLAGFLEYSRIAGLMGVAITALIGLKMPSIFQRRQTSTILFITKRRH